jgi:preprotein translocase subunit SecA
MEDRFWSQGLHQLIEVKEGCPPSARRETKARMTYQRLFRRYERVCGMTGTAREVARELWSVYRLPVVRIPTHRPSRRTTAPPRILPTAAEKWVLVAERTGALARAGIPVLVGTRTVAESHTLSALLAARGVDHRLLNAEQDADEAALIASAGEPGRITVATNMAGRGTDIALAPGVAERGGLHVIVTERHDAGRIDRQLAGRCARQGDPGHVDVILSLEDEVLAFGCATLSGVVLQWLARRMGGRLRSAAIGHAQRRAERVHARMRRDLLRLDNKLGDALAFTGSME